MPDIPTVETGTRWNDQIAVTTELQLCMPDTIRSPIMAATVLNSPRAIEASVYVVRAFVRLREVFASNQELAAKPDPLEKKLSSHDQAIVGILEAIRQLMRPPAATSRPIGFVTPKDNKNKPQARGRNGHSPGETHVRPIASYAGLTLWVAATRRPAEITQHAKLDRNRPVFTVLKLVQRMSQDGVHQFEGGHHFGSRRQA
jgi:hypothetical protein